MLPTYLLRSTSAVSCFASAKRVKYIGVGVALLIFNYNLLSSKKKKIIKGVTGSSIRFVRSLGICATISLDYCVAPLIGHTYAEIHRRSADRILQGCLVNGGIYVKVGQGFAAGNHVLPKEYIETLSALQDKCLTRGKNEVEEIFLQDFGKVPEEMLRKIEPEPVAAASLAQVYKGVTLDGDEVAIKVQYIDLRDRFISDMKALIFLFWLGSIVHPKFDLHWIVDASIQFVFDTMHSLITTDVTRETVLGNSKILRAFPSQSEIVQIFQEVFETLVKELDFENEGKNGERCARDLKKFEYAYVPKVYWDLSSQVVFIQSLINKCMFHG